MIFIYGDNIEQENQEERRVDNQKHELLYYLLTGLFMSVQVTAFFGSLLSFLASYLFLILS